MSQSIDAIEIWLHAEKAYDTLMGNHDLYHIGTARQSWIEYVQSGKKWVYRNGMAQPV